MEDIPRKIGKYEIIAPLGKGAMGVVYKALDPMIQRFVALKTINLNFIAPDDDDVRKRFHREAQAAGNLSHPNIVSIYEYGEETGRAFIAMEYVQGRSLAEMIKKKHVFSIEDCHTIMRQVLDALSYSHGMGVVHRDIKPGNIMLSESGSVKVMDFGIARVESSDLTQTGTILGTPGYMSPEQLLGESVDLRSDLYSTGIVLYELLTGERAFSGSSFASVIYKVINSDLLPPSRLRPTVPGSLDPLVARACAKKAPDRYQTAGAFLADLDRAFHGSPASAAAPAAREMPVPARDAEPMPAGAAPPAGRGVPAMLAGALLLLVAGIAAAAWFYLQRGLAPEVAKTPAAPPPGTIFKDCDTCPEMVVVPGGQFQPSAEGTAAKTGSAGTAPRPVSIAEGMAVSQSEITRAQFSRFALDTGFEGYGCSVYDGEWNVDAARSWRSPGFPQEDDHPATCVSWNDASAFADWLSQKTGHAYRLLTAAEWEYAARAGPSAGVDDRLDAACNAGNVADRSAEDAYPGWTVFDCRDDFIFTSPAGSYQANAFGIYDTIGNVFEWVADCWGENGMPADGDGSCNLRVLRGGSWFTAPPYVDLAFNNRFPADYRSNSFGFRVARLP